MKIIVVSFTLVVVLATCSAGWDFDDIWDDGIFEFDDKRQISGKANVCMERNDTCSLNGRFKCCRGLICQSSGMGGQRRCQRNNNNGGSNGNCVKYGNRCSMSPGSRRCCMGRCQHSMNGRTTCK